MLQLVNKYGFSLIELMLTIAIIAILASTALPAYHQHIIKAHRIGAELAINEIATRLEQYYAKNTTYNGANSNNLAINDSSFKGSYTITITADTNAYLIEADPINNQAVKDTNCGALYLDQNGNKKITGNGDLASCWP